VALLLPRLTEGGIIILNEFVSEDEVVVGGAVAVLLVVGALFRDTLGGGIINPPRPNVVCPLGGAPLAKPGGGIDDVFISRRSIRSLGLPLSAMVLWQIAKKNTPF
jgi:hypothetical protein